MGVLDVIRSGEVSDYYLDIRFEVSSQEGLVGSKIDVVGNVEGLGYWRLQEALQLKAAQQEGVLCYPITYLSKVEASQRLDDDTLQVYDCNLNSCKIGKQNCSDLVCKLLKSPELPSLTVCEGLTSCDGPPSCAQMDL